MALIRLQASCYALCPRSPLSRWVWQPTQPPTMQSIRDAGTCRLPLLPRLFLAVELDRQFTWLAEMKELFNSSPAGNATAHKTRGVSLSGLCRKKKKRFHCKPYSTNLNVGGFNQTLREPTIIYHCLLVNSSASLFILLHNCVMLFMEHGTTDVWLQSNYR